MPTYDASSAEILVFTYKEGLLSAVAHDLELRAERFEIAVDEARRSVTARIETGGIKVVCAMRDGAEQRNALSAKDIRDIEDNLAKDVLDTRRHAELRFESSSVTETAGGWELAGTLTVKGRARPLRLLARRSGDRLIAEVRLHQPDFGIRPFSAMLGTLRIKPDITVRVSLPA
jgi:polyisoprenoid-binding protein YceI